MMDKIRQVDNWPVLTAAEILAAFNRVIVTDDQTAWTSGQLVETIGPSRAIALLAALESSTNPIMRSAFVALSTKDGLTLYQERRQQMIDLLGLDAELTALAKSLGRDARTWWQRNASGDPPSVEAIQAALDEERLEARIANARALMAERLTTEQSAEEHAAIVAQAWIDAGN